MLFTQFFVAILLFNLVLNLYLNYRQMRAIKAHAGTVPADFTASIDIHDHKKAGAYNLAKLRLAQVETIFASAIILLLTLGGGIALINKLCSEFSNYPISYGVIVIAVYMLINTLLNLPFNAYATFNIEQRFGFNKMSCRLFIFDTLKNLLISAIIGIPLLYLILWLMQMPAATNSWWLWVWGVLVIFNLLILLIYPTFIAPLFNKFTPLDDETLKQRISNLLVQCGFKAKGVFIMDGSKRSSHGNAYFTGLGQAKRIVFFDTLLNQLTPSEIEAVLAHELGHFKEKHILKQMCLSFILTLLVLSILSYLIHLPMFYLGLGLHTNIMTSYNALLLFSILVSICSLPFAPIFSYLSRRNEFAADRFASVHTAKEELINGLIKLYKDNASTLTPDALYVKFHYSHPPLSMRIAALRVMH